MALGLSGTVSAALVAVISLTQGPDVIPPHCAGDRSEEDATTQGQGQAHPDVRALGHSADALCDMHTLPFFNERYSYAVPSNSKSLGRGLPLP